jgi:hypothetical protein
MSKQIIPSLEQTVDALVAARFAHDEDDDERIAAKVQDLLKTAAQNATLDHEHDSVRFRFRRTWTKCLV